MSFEQRDMSGAIFKNEKKTEDNHPSMTGSAMIDGVMYWISAWTKEGTKGRFQSLSFKRQEEKPVDKKKVSADFSDMSDDIPF